MKKTTTRFWVDVVMFVSFFGLLITGLIMAFFADSGPNVTEASKYFLKLHRHQWGGIHSYFAIVFTLMLLIHLILEWKWIVGKTRSLLKRAWMLVPIVLVAVLIIFISWAVTPKNYVQYKKFNKMWDQLQRQWPNESPVDSAQEILPDEKPSAGFEIKSESVEITITGQDSLQSIERKTGIPARDIIDLVGLPLDISRTEGLGRLKRVYEFSIQDIREAIRKLLKENPSG